MNSTVRRSYKRIYIGVVFVAAIIGVRVLIDYRFPDHSTTTDTFLSSGDCKVVEINDDFTLLIEQTQSGSDSSRTIQIESRLYGVEFDADSFAEFANQISLFEKDAKQQGVTLRIELGKKRVDIDQASLVFLYAGETCLNEELVRIGLAKVKLEPGISAYRARGLRLAQEQAQKERRGIWKNSSNAAP